MAGGSAGVASPVSCSMAHKNVELPVQPYDARKDAVVTGVRGLAEPLQFPCQRLELGPGDGGSTGKVPDEALQFV